MKIIQNGLNRLRVLASLGATVATLGFGATQARAAWVLQDNFETNLTSTWQLGHAGVGGGVYETSGDYSRSLNNDVYIYSTTGFSSVGRTVIIAPYFAGRNVNTRAYIYLRPYQANVKVNFEVIDPTTWTYIALKTVTLVNNGSYQLVMTDVFVPHRSDVYVRVSVLGNGTTTTSVDVDDLTVVGDATPSFQPTYWNDGSTIQYNNNCYNYSNNRRTDTFAQPGRATGHQYTQISIAAVSSAAISDGLVPTTASAVSPNGQTKIALVIAPGYDYHWYRQDSNGMWTHKPGSTAATNVDNSGNVIYNPETANRGVYTQFAGYFFTPSDAVQGQGHANIN